MLFVHNLISKAICCECTDFCLQLCFSEKGKTTLTTKGSYANILMPTAPSVPRQSLIQVLTRLNVA